MFGYWQQTSRSTSGSTAQRPLGLALVLLSLAGTATADPEDEMMGFIVDRCITRVCHDFYDAFADRLSNTSRLDFNLAVFERPDPRWGSLIWVEYEQRTLYRRFLTPNTVALDGIAKEAADQVKNRIAQSKLEVLLQDTTDLEKDEL
ncbi:Curli production assembly/transport component CsgE [compost metagenome]